MKFGWNSSSTQYGQNHQTINFSSYSNSQLIDQFNTSNWNALSTDNRVGLVQEMENRTASEQGREPAVVVSSDRPGSYGAYNSLSNQMSINVNSFSAYETLDTFYHESNHAYQAHCIEKGIGYDSHTLDMMAVETARDQNGNLYNYAQQNPFYDMQCNELDSNNKAAQSMMAHAESFKNDPAYQNYIAERNEHFTEVNNALENHSDMRTSMQNDQAYTSYVRGDIGEEQYDSLNNSINKESFVDQTVQDSYEVGTQISDLHSELSAEYGNEMASDNSIDTTDGAEGVSADYESDGNGQDNDSGASMDID